MFTIRFTSSREKRWFGNIPNDDYLTSEKANGQVLRTGAKTNVAYASRDWKHSIKTMKKGTASNRCAFVTFLNSQSLYSSSNPEKLRITKWLSIF